MCCTRFSILLLVYVYFVLITQLCVSLVSLEIYSATKKPAAYYAILPWHLEMGSAVQYVKTRWMLSDPAAGSRYLPHTCLPAIDFLVPRFKQHCTKFFSFFLLCMTHSGFIIMKSNENKQMQPELSIQLNSLFFKKLCLRKHFQRS